MILTFAEKNRLKVKNDSCGDPIIPGKWGHIFEYGPGKLGVCIMSDSGNAYRWNRARAAFKTAGMDVTQNADHEGIAAFDPEDPVQVSAATLYAKCKTKKKVSPEHRKAMLANLAHAREIRQHQFAA